MGFRQYKIVIRCNCVGIEIKTYVIDNDILIIRASFTQLNPRLEHSVDPKY